MDGYYIANHQGRDMGEEYDEKVSPPIHIPSILPGVLVGVVHSGQILYINSLSPSVCDHWTQRKVTGKRKVTVDAEKSDGKKIRRP